MQLKYAYFCIFHRLRMYVNPPALYIVIDLYYLGNSSWAVARSATNLVLRSIFFYALTGDSRLSYANQYVLCR